MSVARFIADQRTMYRVPHTVVCALLGVSLAWFYKWAARAASPAAVTGLHTDRARRRDSVDRAVKTAFDRARGLHGSPRLLADLREDGRTVSEKTVADSMRRQGLIARRIRRRNGLTRQDKTAPKFPDRHCCIKPSCGIGTADLPVGHPAASRKGRHQVAKIGTKGPAARLSAAGPKDLWRDGRGIAQCNSAAPRPPSGDQTFERQAT